MWPAMTACQHLAPGSIRIIEPTQYRAVEIEYAEQRLAFQQRHHQLGTRRGVAGDMTRERLDVRHQH